MAVDIFLKLDGIEGESDDAAHGKEIEVLSFSWGSSNSASFATGTGGGAGKVNMQDLTCTVSMGKASPTLMLYCAAGTHIPSGELTVRKAGDKPQDFLKIKLTDILVSTYQTGASGGGGDLPIDTFSLAFAQIDMDYKPQNKDGSLGGSVKGGWNVKTNKKS